MASNAIIGALRVILGVDSAHFDKGLKDAESRLGRFGKSVASITAGIGLERALTAVVSSLVHGFKELATEADKFGMAAQRIGIPVEDLSKLNFVAKQSDVTFETLEKSLTKLQRSMNDAVAAPTSKAAETFRHLGINVRDTTTGAIKPLTDVLIEMAGKWEGTLSATTKTTAAFNLMGRSGTQLTPMLNNGAEAMRKMMEEAQGLGAVITTKTAVAADMISDDLVRLSVVNRGLINQITQELAPAFRAITDAIVKYLIEQRKVTGGTIGIAEWVLSTVEGVLKVANVFKMLGETINATWEIWAGFFTLSGDRIREGVKLAQETITNFGERAAANAVFMDELRAATKRYTDELNNATAAGRGGADSTIKQKNALDSFLESQQKSLASKQAELKTLGMEAGAKEAEKIRLEARAIAIANNIPLTAALRAEIEKLAIAAGDMNSKLAGGQLILDAKEPHEKFRMEMANNEIALLKFGATGEQIMQVQQKLAEKYGATWGQVIPTVAGQFAGLFNELAKHGSHFATLAKAFAIVEATVNTYVAFTKALASAPPPFNYVLAAGVLAAGMAKVMSIKSQQVPKMAGGGMLMPKSFPGPDSVLMQARVRPDEEVHVVRPGDVDPRRSGGFTVVQMQLPFGAAGRFVEELIKDINSKVADGYRLNTVPV